jgi:dTDP-4-dehydrorhamnose 3,5-epimerase
MQFIKTKIPGCWQIQTKKISDHRGCFVKTFQLSEYESAFKDLNFVEEYYSISQKNVIRGMHFQEPPFEHSKLVYCVCGKVVDVVLDLRVDSPTFKQFEIFDLSSENANMLFITKGIAHGFLSLCDQTVMMYKVTSEYNSQADMGILWNSFGFEWPVTQPILSIRDTGFMPLSEYKSFFKV